MTPPPLPDPAQGHPPILPPTAALPRRVGPASPSALELLDEAVHRLRLAPLATLAIYYLGTLPFLLALLSFCADHTLHPAATAALRLTLLFVVMKSTHAVFIASVHAQLRGQARVRWTARRLGRLAFVQTVIQGTGLFVLNAPTAVTFLPAPGVLVFLASLALTLPLGWVYALFQNVTVYGDGESAAVRPVLTRAFRAALRQPGQNHAALSALTLLGLFAWINLLFAVVGLPYLLRMFTGEENGITRSGTHLFNFTFCSILFGLVYLALDPWAKTFYLLRCFHADSPRPGEDLPREPAALSPAPGSVPPPLPPPRPL